MILIDLKRGEIMLTLCMTLTLMFHLDPQTVGGYNSYGTDGGDMLQFAHPYYNPNKNKAHTISH